MKLISNTDTSLGLSASIIGNKWNLLIIRDAFYGYSRFGEFQKSLGVAKTVLSARLLHLGQAGILLRKQNKHEVDRYRYELSDKGLALLPAVVALLQWEQRCLEHDRVDIIDLKHKEAVQDMQVKCVKGNVLNIQDIAFKK